MIEIKVPKDVLDIIDTLTERGHEAYVVGGCIRDSLMGHRVNDWDISTSAEPEEVMSVFGNIEGFRVIPTGLKHGTVTVLYNGVHYEITTHRIEGEYSDRRRPDSVSFTKDVQDDLSRRDFTINAMAYSHENGIVDPFGGMDDIERGVVRCVGDPDRRFDEDALRMFRAVRFATQLEFEIEENTFESILRNKRHACCVSVERIRQEFDKLLLSRVPSKGICLLVDTGLMEYISPEVYDMVGFDQRHPYHDKDLFEHTMVVLDNTPQTLNVRLAALFHDIGKPRCMELDERGIAHYYGHDDAGAEITISILKRLRYDKRTIEAVEGLIREHMDKLEGFSKKGIKRFINRLGRQNLEDYFSLIYADVLGCKEPFDFGYLEDFKERVHNVLMAKEPMTISDLAVNGYDLIALGFPQSKVMSDTIHYLFDTVLGHPELNERKLLLDLAAKKLEEYKAAEDKNQSK